MTPDSKSPTRVLLVDDHPLLLHGLSQVIEQDDDMTVCGKAEDGPQALTLVDKLEPDMVIVDLSLQTMHGLELIKAIKSSRPDTRMLVVSMHDEALYAERSIRAGAGGYIMKQDAIEKVREAIRAVMAGELYVSGELAERFVRQYLHTGKQQLQAPEERLSDREMEILNLIGSGLRTNEIAERLSRSAKTIEAHRANIKSKLGLQSAGELTRFAIQWVNDNTR